jgi:anti-sigma regulatory factor (Ser/Thr protein kinase)
MDMGDRRWPGASVRAEFRVPSRPESVAAARHFAEPLLSVLEHVGLAEIVVLLLSEVVTNAVVHARPSGDGDIWVGLEATGGQVRVEVHDQDHRVPQLRPALPGRESGRGLSLVNGLASAWGVRAEPPGKAVWFEVRA